MKKRIASILAAVLLVTSCTASLAACGGNNEDKATLTHETKVTMPTDGDMQTVAVADVSNELNTFRQALYDSENGKYQIYSLSKQEEKQTGKFGELDENGEFLGTYDMATNTVTSMSEIATSYCGINDATNPSGALTTCIYYLNQSSTDNTNPNLSHLNYSLLSDYRFTAIQKNSEMFLFNQLKHKDYSGLEAETPQTLIKYSDDSNKYPNETINLPLEEAIFDYNYESVYTLTRGCYGVSKSAGYLMNNNEKYELFAPEEYWDYKDFEINDFDLTVKKSQTKLYATTKYTIKFIPYTAEDGYNYYSTKEGKIDVEYTVLIDLGTPSSLNTLSTHGIDVADLKLSNAAKDFAYLDITSQELTQAVEEGRTITVDVLGNGDVSKFKVLDLDYQEIPVVDGKVTIDGAALKELITDYYNWNKYFYLEYYFSPDGNNDRYSSFCGYIRINYSPNN